MVRWMTLGLVLMVGPMAWATPDPSREVVADETDPTVLLANQELFKLRAAAGGYAPAERWVLVNQRFQTLLSGSQQAVRPADVRVSYHGADAGVWLGSELLVSATSADADANHTTPARLARQWARNLRDALAGMNRGVQS